MLLITIIIQIIYTKSSSLEVPVRGVEGIERRAIWNSFCIMQEIDHAPVNLSETERAHLHLCLYEVMQGRSHKEMLFANVDDLKRRIIKGINESPVDDVIKLKLIERVETKRVISERLKTFIRHFSFRNSGQTMVEEMNTLAKILHSELEGILIENDVGIRKIQEMDRLILRNLIGPTLHDEFMANGQSGPQSS